MIKTPSGIKKPHKNCLRIRPVVVFVACIVLSKLFESHLMPRSIQNNNIHIRIKEKTEPVRPEASKCEQNKITGIQRDQIKNARFLRGLLSIEVIEKILFKEVKLFLIGIP